MGYVDLPDYAIDLLTDARERGGGVLNQSVTQVLSRIDAVDASMFWWRAVEYVSFGLVLIGVVGEGVVDFVLREGTSRARALGRASLLVLILGLAGEGLTLFKTNELADQEVGLLRLSATQLEEDNLALEASLSPRTFEDQGAAADALKPFVPVAAVVEYLPDLECKRTGERVAFVLTSAGWRLGPVRANPNESEFLDGITVQVNAAGAVPEDTQRAARAADALVAELNKRGLKAMRGAPDPKYEQGLVVVHVGMKPEPATERLLKQWQQKIEEHNRAAESQGR
jgi:hypothetical protein